MNKKTVSFHDDPPKQTQTDKYKEALAKAKQSQQDKPGDLSNTPKFDSASTWSEPAKQPGSGFLTEDTKRGLAQLAKSAKAEQVSMQQTQQETPQDAVEEEEVLTTTEKLQRAIEGRIDAIDIGEYLMSGEVKQSVPIIPGKLEVVFRTVSDLEESHIDNLISKEPSDLTNRQFLRKMNEYALVIHIHSVNGNKWPTIQNGDGTVNDQSIEARLKHVRKLSSPVFNLLTQNLAWFTERVNEGLTASALGNG